MLSRDLLRSDPDRVRAALAARGAGTGPVDEWRRLDEERRRALVEVEELKHRRNEASKEIGTIKKAGGDAADRIAEVGGLKERIAELEGSLGPTEERLSTI